VQFLGIDPSGQTDPQDEAAGRTRHLCAFREILLHCQLEGAEVLAVLLTDVTQVPIVATILQVRGDAHLRDAARGVGAEHLQALDFLLVLAGDHPADAHAGGQRLGKTGAIDHPIQTIIGLQGLGAA